MVTVDMDPNTVTLPAPAGRQGGERPDTALDNRAVLDTATDAVVGFEPTGRIVYANAAAERLFGWPAAELVGQQVTRLVSPRADAGRGGGVGASSLLARQVPSLVGRTFALTGLRRDGTDTDVEVSLSAVRDRGSRLLIATVRSAHERLDVERQLDITRWLRAVNHAATRLAALTDREAILHFTATTLQRSFGMVLAEAWVYAADGGALTARASRGPVPRDRPARVSLDDPASALVRVVGSHRTEVLRGRELADLAGQRWVDRERVVAAVLLPLSTGDQPHGVLTGFTRHPPLGEQVETLANFATLVAAAITGVHRLDREREARALAERAQRQAAFLVEASMMLASSLDSGSTMALIGDLLVPKLADWLMIDLFEGGSSGVLRRAFVRCADPDLADVVGRLASDYPLDPMSSHDGIADLVTASTTRVGADLRTDDHVRLAQDEGHARLLASMDLRSFVSAALVSRGVTLGALSVARGRSGLNTDFAPEDVMLVESLARRVAAGPATRPT